MVTRHEARIMTEHQLRAANASDALEISRVHADSFARAWSIGDVEALLAGPGAALVAFSSPGGALVGFVIGRIVVDEAEILSVAVARSDRRKGLGRRLVRAFADLASTRGAQRIFLEVAAGNSDARALYEASGFQATGVRRGYYEEPGRPPEDAIVMLLDLSAAASSARDAR
jgi:ribosomal-protein-alanine N-acetyltransferase